MFTSSEAIRQKIIQPLLELGYDKGNPLHKTDLRQVCDKRMLLYLDIKNHS